MKREAKNELAAGTVLSSKPKQVKRKKRRNIKTRVSNEEYLARIESGTDIQKADARKQLKKRRFALKNIPGAKRKPGVPRSLTNEDLFERAVLCKTSTDAEPPYVYTSVHRALKRRGFNTAQINRKITAILKAQEAGLEQA